MIRKANYKKGFTLVEMIVSLGIFTVVALVAVGALMKITNANKKALTLKTTINNLNFALESMSREMRVGSKYYCTSNTSSAVPANYTSSGCDVTGEWLIAFTSSKVVGSCRLIYAYRYKVSGGVGTLEKAQQDPSNCSNSITNSDFNQLISSDINITNSIISVNVTNQPKAFLWFSGYNGTREREKTEFSLQTSVSQRLAK